METLAAGSKEDFTSVIHLAREAQRELEPNGATWFSGPEGE